MKQATLFGKLLICAAVVGVLLLTYSTVAAQDNNNNHVNASEVATGVAPVPYNPYPPGILPTDLVSEIARVRREVAVIENEALAQWRALPIPTLTGQPPTLQGTGQRAN